MVLQWIYTCSYKKYTYLFLAMRCFSNNKFTTTYRANYLFDMDLYDRCYLIYRGKYSIDLDFFFVEVEVLTLEI